MGDKDLWLITLLSILDYILITHDHYDHFSPEDIRKVAKSGSVLVVPEKMASKAQEIPMPPRRQRL